VRRMLWRAFTLAAPIKHITRPAQNDKTSRYFDHMALRCNDLDGIRLRLDQHGIPQSEFEAKDVNQLQIFRIDPRGLQP